MRTTDEIIHQLARLGLLERGRLLAAGVSDREIRRRIERGSLRPLHPGVYATFGTPLDYRARVLAGCLSAGPGAVASHRSALSIWGLLDGEQSVEITAPRPSHPVPGGYVLHRPNVLRPVDVTTRRLVPITNPMRSLLDAGAVLPRHVVGEYQPTLVLDGVELRPDFLVSRALTIIEVDGLDAHRSREALDHDLARQNLLVRHGFLVLRYTTTHLRRPAQVTKEIVTVCRQRITDMERRPAA